MNPPLKLFIILAFVRPLLCIAEKAARMWSGLNAVLGSAGGRKRVQTGASVVSYSDLRRLASGSPLSRSLAAVFKKLLASAVCLRWRASVQRTLTISKARKPRMSMVSSPLLSCMCVGKFKNSLNRAARCKASLFYQIRRMTSYTLSVCE